MRFIPFQKVATSTSQFQLPGKREEHRLYNSVECGAFEKGDGAHYALLCDGNVVVYAKRTGILNAGEWFYGHESISDTLRVHALEMHRLVKSKHPDTAYIIIDGELCGGFYPEDPNSWLGAVAAGRVNLKNECPLPLEQRAVQEGVYYSPNMEFIALAVTRVTVDYLATPLDYDPMAAMCKAVGLHYLTPRRRGTYNQCMSENCVFDSTIAVELFGQRQLPTGTNLAEGLVIMPLSGAVTVRLRNGDVVRPMVKRKHPNFSEISGDFSASDITANVLLVAMVNVNRLNALLSKMGRPTQENVAEAIDAFVDDVFADYYAEHADVVIKDYDEAQGLVCERAKRLVHDFWERALRDSK
jgi:Rnl2 family RNA ligase